MKAKREKIIFVTLIICTILVLISSMSVMQMPKVSASTEDCNLGVVMINQDPYPAVPDSYVNVVFQVSGIGNSYCKGVKFRLVPKYPFSFDAGQDPGWKVVQGSTYIPTGMTDWNLPYKLRVDKDALDGNSSVDVYYGKFDNLSADLAYNSIIKSFDIVIEDSRTSFDGVLQEASGSSISIAIANTGKYTANSMIVRIPEQENFRVSGTNGQMVGNLNSGDYTIVGFTVTQIPNVQRVPGTNSSLNRNSLNSDLKVQIDYTDGIGERRTSTLEIPVQGSILTNSTASFPNGFGSRRQSTGTSIFSKWYFWVIVVVVVLVGLGFLNKYKKRIKNAVNKGKQKSNEKKDKEDSPEPDWVKKERERKK